MYDVYLGLGSNLGDRQTMLREAIRAIGALPDTALVAKSPTYETPPMGPQDQDAYFNMAAHIRTALEPFDLVAMLQKIESDLGRADIELRRHWGPREIDIDVLLFADRVISAPALTVPHTRMPERWFVLKPLSDIAPAVVHPVLQKSVQALLEQLLASEVNA
jgi:2-amino-4-hydroxy-6-hydroxymethyldihydropteridine diphosphokinase